MRFLTLSNSFSRALLATCGSWYGEASGQCCGATAFAAIALLVYFAVGRRHRVGGVDDLAISRQRHGWRSRNRQSRLQIAWQRERASA